VVSIAIQTPPEHTTFAALRALWEVADRVGFRAAFTFDHLVPLNPPPTDPTGPVGRGPQLDGWTALAALAATTRRLEAGTLVSGVTYRHPAILAKMAVTLDAITDGRAILGVGAAWHAAEHAAFGIDFPGVGERVERLDETLQVVRLLCETDGPVSFSGRWYRLDGAVLDPRPVRAGGLPVLVGGSGPRVLRLAARHADLYNGFWAPWEWPERNAWLDEAVVDAGRTATSLERSAFVFAELSGDAEREADLVAHVVRTRGGTAADARRRVVLGDPGQAVDVLRAYGDGGVDLVVLNLRPPVEPDALERFAAAVLPELGAAVAR
jgi:alkanesulfonate monooxygenase SsuD/methylene tetrahydromethanopterin reductase-like flavin-dependent oxidoreductase (luciferase family)